MNEEFCPAGKIECEHYVISIGERRACYFQPTNKFMFQELDLFEVCPWPSRYQPTPPAPNCQPLNTGDVESVVAEIQSEHFLKGYNRGYLAGAADQIKRDGEAVCDRADEIGGEYGDVLRDQAIAAITALKK